MTRLWQTLSPLRLYKLYPLRFRRSHYLPGSSTYFVMSSCAGCTSCALAYACSQEIRTRKSPSSRFRHSHLGLASQPRLSSPHDHRLRWL